METPQEMINLDRHEKEQIFTIVILGNSFVGKTSLVNRFINNKFPEKHDPTIQDTYKTEVKVNNETIKIEIIDTAGEEDYEKMVGNWIDEGDGILLVFSIDDYQSYERTKNIYKEITIKEKTSPIIFVGNKCDIEDKREVPKEEAQDYTKVIGVKFYEVSAKNDQNCKEPFNELANEIVLNLNQKKNERKEKGSTRRGSCYTCQIF